MPIGSNSGACQWMDRWARLSKQAFTSIGTRYITGLHCCYRPIHRTHDSILAGFCCHRPILWTHDRTRATKKAPQRSCDAIPYFAERPRFRRASPSGISWGSLIEVKHIGITDLRSSGAFPLNDPYESMLSTGHPSKKHRS